MEGNPGLMDQKRQLKFFCINFWQAHFCWWSLSFHWSRGGGGGLLGRSWRMSDHSLFFLTVCVCDWLLYKVSVISISVSLHTTVCCLRALCVHGDGCYGLARAHSCPLCTFMCKCVCFRLYVTFTALSQVSLLFCPKNERFAWQVQNMQFCASQPSPAPHASSPTCRGKEDPQLLRFFCSAWKCNSCFRQLSQVFVCSPPFPAQQLPRSANVNKPGLNQNRWARSSKDLT